MTPLPPLPLRGAPYRRATSSGNAGGPRPDSDAELRRPGQAGAPAHLVQRHRGRRLAQHGGQVRGGAGDDGSNPAAVKVLSLCCCYCNVCIFFDGLGHVYGT